MEGAIGRGQGAKLVGAYFRRSGGWGEPEARDIGPRLGIYCDPVYVVSGAVVV